MPKHKTLSQQQQMANNTLKVTLAKVRQDRKDLKGTPKIAKKVTTTVEEK